MAKHRIGVGEMPDDRADESAFDFILRVGVGHKVTNLKTFLHGYARSVDCSIRLPSERQIGLNPQMDERADLIRIVGVKELFAAGICCALRACKLDSVARQTRVFPPGGVFFGDPKEQDIAVRHDPLEMRR